MIHYSIKVWATATVSADNEDKAKLVLESLARSEQVNLMVNRECEHGSIFLIGTIDLPVTEFVKVGED